MRFPVTIKDHFRETELFSRRVISFIVIISLLSIVLVIRLTYLQIVSHDHYTTLSQNNRVHILPVPPPRGVIYDRNGTILAQNFPTFSLEIIPERIDDMDDNILKLKEIVSISDVDIKRFRKLLKRSRRFQSIPIRYRLNEDEVARFSVNRHRFPGVDINARLTRHYPLGELAVHAVGYVGRIDDQEIHEIDTSNYKGTSHIGKTGVEKYYENILHGYVGHQEVETNAQGRTIRVLSNNPPIPGQNLYLNIDANLQHVAKVAFGDNSGALVAIEPTTGAVLAFVSRPAYDPNLFVNGIAARDYSLLTRSPERPLLNRALNGQYPPGSTAKPFIGLAGLESGEIDMSDSTFCRGWYKLKKSGRRYRDWKKQGHGKMSLNQAITQSCDVFFYDLALRLGIDRISEFLKYFGIGQATGIDLLGEPQGILPSREWKRQNRGESWYPGETLITGIGQGYMLATPLQLASITATLANYGRRMQPKLVHGVQDPTTNEIGMLGATLTSVIPITDLENWRKIIDSMLNVVHHWRGTAHRLSKDLIYKIAGKTGTSQVYGLKQDEKYDADKIPKKLRDHALFIAFAPVDPLNKPRIALAVIVEHGGHGSSAAAPIARKVLDAYLIGSDS